MAQIKRKKKFFDVEIPLIEKTTHLYAYEQKNLNNRYIKYDLTRILKGKSILLTLKVQANDQTSLTIPRKIELLSYYIRRMIRKNTDYVEDSFQAESQDSLVLIKPLLITRRKVSRAIKSALREKIKQELSLWASEKNSEELFKDILKNKIQKVLLLKLKKIYPLSLCEIRVFEILKDLEPKKSTLKKVKEKPTEDLIDSELKEKD